MKTTASFSPTAVDRDAEAFQKVMAAYKRPKDERAPFVEEALHGAAEVPLEVYERACAMARRLDALQIPAKFGSDLAVAKALVVAAKAGVMENVRINLESIQDEAFKGKSGGADSGGGVEWGNLLTRLYIVCESDQATSKVGEGAASWPENRAGRENEQTELHRIGWTT